MLISKKTTFIIAAIAILLITGTWLVAGKAKDKSSNNNRPDGVTVASSTAELPIIITERNDAFSLAMEFIRNQPFAKDYGAEPVKVENFKDFWSVWFDKMDQTARPNKGLVQIDKRTGEAEWKHLD